MLRIPEILKGLEKITPEIRYKSCVENKNVSIGLISFTPRRNPDSKQITHRDKDVLCHVLKGRGRLRINKRKLSLEPGMLCHIPKGTPHDFAAAGKKELVLFYSLFKTG
ncbi:MAG: cupin domain-containing protein [Deltaproteobacteria bacterium]|nr:cupin domain-containing protein [Deltaproteobacteria bacterium]